MKLTKPLSTLAIVSWIAYQAQIHQAFADVSIGELHCEGLENPLGIDATRPRLSWIMQSKERGERQTAWQVCVASTQAKLKADQGDLWDSGKVLSDQTIQVRYGGKPLTAHAECFWKVRTWDKSGKQSAWSQPAHWTMGLLSPSDWKAEW